jgi:hypothetical protein
MSHSSHNRSDVALALVGPEGVFTLLYAPLGVLRIFAYGLASGALFMLRYVKAQPGAIPSAAEVAMRFRRNGDPPR